MGQNPQRRLETILTRTDELGKSIEKAAQTANAGDKKAAQAAERLCERLEKTIQLCEDSVQWFHADLDKTGEPGSR
jgi:hypothetical protein